MFFVIGLVLRSLNPITKDSAMITGYLRWASPDPGVGPPIELRSSDAGGLLNLFGIGKALPSECVTTEEPPPALLQIEPTRSGGNKDVMDARMIGQPGACLEAGMTAEIVSDHKDVSRWVVSFDVGQQGNVAFGIARSGTASQFFAIAHS